MTILCEPDPQAAAALAPGLRGDVRAVASLPDVAMALAADPAEDLVIVGSTLPLEQVLSFSGWVHDQRPEVAVVLLRDSADDTTLAGASSAGVREVVAAHDAPGLLAACERTKPEGTAVLVHPDAPGETGPTGQVVTVFSAKGGCGKTMVATNLSVALNAGGARRVCLVDLDLAFGDVAITLQLTPNRTLIDAVSMPTHDDGFLDALLTPFAPGLDCVLAPVEPGDAEKLPAAVISDVLSRLRSRYEYVVVDTPSQFSEHVLAALDASQHHVLLTAPEIPALKNLRLTLDMLDLLSYGRELRSIVLNRSDSRVGLSAADVQDTIKAPIAAHVPSSRDVPMSVNQGRPIALAKPEHPVSQAIRRLAERTIVDEPVAARKRFGRRARQ